MWFVVDGGVVDVADAGFEPAGDVLGGVDALLERIRSRNLTSFLITTPDGRLVGLALRRDLE